MNTVLNEQIVHNINNLKGHKAGSLNAQSCTRKSQISHEFQPYEAIKKGNAVKKNRYFELHIH